MDSLIDLKLVKPLNPSRYIQRIPHFDETFIRYINHPACQINCEGREARPQSPVDVHWEKISPNILENSRERGLVKREQGPWVGIEAYTAINIWYIWPVA